MITGGGVAVSFDIEVIMIIFHQVIDAYRHPSRRPMNIKRNFSVGFGLCKVQPLLCDDAGYKTSDLIFKGPIRDAIATGIHD